jgi:hypothetical protein
VADLFAGDEDAVSREESRGSGASADERWEDGLGEGNAREIDVVPLCAQCLVESELDELDDRTVIQKGLRGKGPCDGGFSRRRWEAKQQVRPAVKAMRSADVSHPILS